MNVTQGNSLRGIHKKNRYKIGNREENCMLFNSKQNGPKRTYVRFMSYSKCSDWCWILKLALNFGCLFTFYYSAGTNLLKTKLHACKLQTGQSISYTCVNQC